MPGRRGAMQEEGEEPVAVQRPGSPRASSWEAAVSVSVQVPLGRCCEKPVSPDRDTVTAATILATRAERRVRRFGDERRDSREFHVKTYSGYVS